MKQNVRCTNNTDKGSALVAFLILSSICLMLVYSTLQVGASSTRTTVATKVRTQRYYSAESSLHTAAAWLRTNSLNLLKPFSASEFYALFQRTAPSLGSNDTGPTAIPTKVKLRGTSESAILSNDEALASARFVATANIATGASFDAVSQFQSAEFDNTLVRITLVDAIALDPSKDSPPLSAAETDFYPVYRVDALTGSDRGSHVYGYVTGNLFYIDTVGFYGRDFADIRQDCKSATFTGATPGALNAKCPVGSQGNINVAENAKVYGSARSNVGVNPANKVCADYPSCTAQGSTCQGSSCAVPNLPTFQSWSTYCPTNNGDYEVEARKNRILVTAGCYDDVSILNRGSLTLQNTTQPYYFKTLTIDGGNPSTQLKIAPSPDTATVQLYVETIVGATLNGNQAVNPSYKPSQFRLYYLSATDLLLNGNANMAMSIVAPYANVTLTGNSDYYGGIIAKGLTLAGSSNITYDESLGGRSLSDLTFRLRDVSQKFN